MTRPATSTARWGTLALLLLSISASASTSSEEAPAPTDRLQVRVTDAAGEPVEGAVVVARPSAGASRPFGGVDHDQVRTSITDTAGKAALEAMPAGPWTLQVLARAYAPRTLFRVASATLDVHLDRGGAITGIVADAEGVPLPGARVSLETGMPLPDAWAEEARRVETTADAEGGFQLDGIGARPVTVVARAPGYGRATRESVTAGAHVELFLFPGATLAGLVVDEEGKPLEGALVQASGGGLWSKAPPSERTDAEGAFSLAGVEKGEYVVMAREGGRAPGLARVVVEGEDEAFVEVVVTAGGFASGRVVDVSGEPQPAKVEAVTFEGVGLPDFGRERFRTEAREDGTFVLGPLPPGELGIEAFVPGHVATRVDAVVAEPGVAVDLGDVVVDRGGTIRGRVVDAEGAGVSGARVRAWPRSGRPRHWPEASSGDDGAFEVGGLDDGRYTLAASKSGYAEVQAEAGIGDEDVELLLEAGGEVVGRVVDADGRPAPDALLSAARSDGESRRGGRPSAYARVEDEEGRFALRDVRAGIWVLNAQARGLGEASVPDVRVTGGRTTDVGTVRLARGGVIRGTVVDTDGVGVPGAAVQAERDVSMRSGRLATQSGAGGAFEIRGVPAGRLAVFARHPAYAPGGKVVVEVDPAVDPEPVRLLLSRGGSIEGTALHRDGRPFQGGRVMAQGLGPERRAVMPESAALSPDGWYRLDHVPAGRTRAHLMAFVSRSPTGSGGPSNILTAVAVREVEVRDGETSTVDFPLRDVVVTGEVTRGGRPAPMLLLGLMGDGGMTMHFAGATSAGAAAPPPGPQPLTGVTGEDGRYELLVLSPGTFHLMLTDLAGGQSHPARKVEVPDAERFELDLELASSLVAGVLVDAETGEGVRDGRVRLAEPEGPPAGAGPAGPDGRFSLPVEPGVYRLTAQAPGRRPVVLEVDVGAAGLEDLRLEMETGLEIRGRLVDASGRPAASVRIAASTGAAGPPASTISLPDGTFRLGGLDEGPYVLAAGTGLAGFAIRVGVRPTEDPLLLKLRPGGRVSVRVLDAVGQPVKDVWPAVRLLDGVRLSIPGLQSGMTGPDGVAVLDAPTGAVGIEVRAENQRGQGTVAVRPGETSSLEIVMEPQPANETP